MIEFERWFWCELCGHQAISCNKCNFSSCSGAGCAESVVDGCWNDFEEANRMIGTGEAPPKDKIPFHPKGGGSPYLVLKVGVGTPTPTL